MNIIEFGATYKITKFLTYFSQNLFSKEYHLNLIDFSIVGQLIFITGF